MCTKITTTDFQSAQNTREKTGTHTKGWNPCLKVGLHDLKAGLNLKVGFHELKVGLHNLKVGLRHLKFRFSDLKVGLHFHSNDSVIKLDVPNTCVCPRQMQLHMAVLSKPSEFPPSAAFLAGTIQKPYLECPRFRVAVGDGLCQEAAPAHGILLVGELPSSELHVQDATLGKD